MKSNDSKYVPGGWNSQRFFPINRALGKGFDLYVSAGLLIKRFNVKLKTIKNGVSRFNRNKSKNWRSYRDHDAIVIDYDTIPIKTKIYAKMPFDGTAAYALMKAEISQFEDLYKDAEVLHLRLSFEEAYQNRWPIFQKFYADKIITIDERILFARSHALVEAIINASDKKWPSKVIFSTYSTFIKTQLDSLEEPKFKTLSPIYFWRVIRNCKLQGIPATLIHDSKGVPREYLVKMTGAIKAFIRLQLRNPKNLIIADIIKNVRSKYHVDLSPSSIKSFKAKNETRNILEYDSNGIIQSKQNGLPKLTRFLAEDSGEQYQGDYYKLQFICRNVTGNIVRLWAFIVLDVFSKKMVGWALNEHRSATLAKDAFKMAFVNHCLLPEEIIVDNDTLYKRPVFKNFIRRTNNLGVIWTKAYPNMPSWKAEIEGSFAVFQKLHSSKDWYIGESVKSKNVAGNPSKEFVNSLWRKATSMLNVQQMTTEFGKMVEEYNSNTNNGKKKFGPVDYFKMYQSKRSIKFEHWMESLLFWKTKTKKRIKNDGRIDLEIDTVKYQYQVTKADQLWEYKNSDVRMCYNPKDLSRIHLFERQTLKFIGEIEPRMVLTRENKDEVLHKHRTILRESHKYIRDKRKEDESIVQGTPSGISAKVMSLDDKIMKRQMKRERFDQTVMEVEVHP